MAERMAAEIKIGGPVPAPLVPELLALLSQEGVVVGWEEIPFSATTITELLHLAQDDSQPVPLHMVDYEAAWGRFAALEAFLAAHAIAFDRRTEAKYEYDAELVQFRPGMQEPCVQATNQDGEPVVTVSYLRPVCAALEQGHARQAFQLLRCLLGPEIAPLEPLRIVKEPERQPRLARTPRRRR